MLEGGVKVELLGDIVRLSPRALDETIEGRSLTFCIIQRESVVRKVSQHAEKLGLPFRVVFAGDRYFVGPSTYSVPKEYMGIQVDGEKPQDITQLNEQLANEKVLMVEFDVERKRRQKATYVNRLFSKH